MNIGKSQIFPNINSYSKFLFPLTLFTNDHFSKPNLAVFFANNLAHNDLSAEQPNSRGDMYIHADRLPNCRQPK